MMHGQKNITLSKLAFTRGLKKQIFKKERLDCAQNYHI